jgi:hypothetical protein
MTDMAPSTIEALVVAALLAALLRSLLGLSRGRGAWRFSWVSWLALPVAVAWAAIALRERPLAEGDVAIRPIAVEEPGYVSSDACQTCHPWQYEAWHRSYHRTMTQVVTGETVIADFDDVTLTLDGKSYHLTTDGDSFWVEMDDPASQGSDPPKRVKRRVVVSTGSHHEQDYWLEGASGDRRLQLFPFSHNRREGRWVPFRSVFLSPPPGDATPAPGLWNSTCIDCHTTRPLSRIRYWTEDDRSYDSRVTEFGIACEACHGPGGEHVRLNRNLLHRFRSYLRDGGDESIVNPARLDAKRSSQICGSCHGIFVKKGSRGISDEGGRLALVTGFATDPWVPGKDIEESRVYLRPRLFGASFAASDEEKHRVVQQQLKEGLDVQGYFWSDGMVRISGREYSAMIESPCYERGTLACSSCHRLHAEAEDPRPLSEWADDQLGRGMDGNRACVSCHTAYAGEEALVNHTHHSPSSHGSECYNCHMPYTVYGIQKAIRSHQIDSPSVAASVATGRPNACNQCHLDRTLAWASAHLSAWYGMPPPKLSPKERQLAAGVLWAIQGEAGQRALMAWSMGWEPALEASGSDWMTPILAMLLADPYASVRFLAARSLRKREGFADFAYDFVAFAPDQSHALARALDIWKQRRGEVPNAPGAGLQKPDGSFDYDRLLFLANGRDNRLLTLHE